MPAATVRRSLVRGFVAMLFVVLATVAGLEPDPVELHVISRGDATAGTQAAGGTPPGVGVSAGSGRAAHASWTLPD